MEKVRVFFDEEADILEVQIGKARKAVSKETKNDVIKRIDPETGELIGFTILNFLKRFKKEDERVKGIGITP
ncbi:MAG: DUF2283 domain-containing protein [Candidatus Korarchaeota archaeon]|nr:DUF2283 domain-containing protein [Candidatus Korarchaeota archaeon]NIU85586.1 DUF2283 domain-containing protein [Candidatus Thorarchaeota archaeon]NIW15130.1 DUF2283 domain-containing protein [Candidatus Thorarchaeota archaeon]NIW53135.1 DUF2283 domain-containing protein [Candidatus Korarchaeota archaeon]